MKITLKSVLHWHKYSWQDESEYQLYPSDMSTCGPEYVPIKEVEVEVEIPADFDPAPQQIAALKQKKQEILAEAHIKAENIEQQIQSLLCIEHKPEVPA